MLQRWDALRRHLETWEALVSLRFQQNTQDAAARAAREYADELRPKLTDAAVRLKRRFLKSPLREVVEQTYGALRPRAVGSGRADVRAGD